MEGPLRTEVTAGPVCSLSRGSSDSSGAPCRQESCFTQSPLVPLSTVGGAPSIMGTTQQIPKTHQLSARH